MTHQQYRASWPRSLEIVAVASSWGLLTALAVVRRALLPNPPFSLHTVAVTLVEYTPWAVLTPLIFRLARRLPPTRQRWAIRLLLHIGVACGVALLVGELQQRTITALGPPAGVEQGMEGGRHLPPVASPGGPPLVQLPYQLLFYFIILGVGFARAYALELRERQGEAARLSAERERLAAQLSEARLQALRMQLNPHFLFNTLNAVSALAEDDPAGVRRIVSRLSTLLRRVLDTEATVEAPLRDELAFLRDYLDIQRIRFERRLEIEEEIDVDTLDALLPPFILQPIVENAVEHGAGRVREGVGRITLRARRETRGDGTCWLVLRVGDNGPGAGLVLPDGGERRGGIGLSNTRERLRAHYGEHATLALHSAEGCGLDVEITIPWHTSSSTEPRLLHD